MTLDLDLVEDLSKALANAAALGYADSKAGARVRTGNEVRKADRSINRYRNGYVPALREAYKAGRFAEEMERAEDARTHALTYKD